jgi:arylsulfatase A-like enzyme
VAVWSRAGAASLLAGALFEVWHRGSGALAGALDGGSSIALGAALGVPVGLVVFEVSTRAERWRSTFRGLPAPGRTLVLLALIAVPWLFLCAARLVVWDLDGVLPRLRFLVPTGVTAALAIALFPRPRATAVDAAFPFIALVVAAMIPSSALGTLPSDGPGSLARRYLSALTDVDADGASSLFGGRDCAPWDARVGPTRAEVPGNGVDDNCLGGDLRGGDEAGGGGYEPPPPGAPRAPNLVLVTVDALRADHLGTYGYTRPTSPNLDRLATRAVVFEDAVAQGPGTFESLPSLLTSRYPYRVSYLERSTSPPPLSPENRTIAGILAEAGYRTEAVLACHLERKVGWGLCRGFHRCDDSPLPERNPEAVTSPRVTGLARAALARLTSNGKPFFLWVHYFDPHSTYLAHRGFLEEGAVDEMGRYDSELAFTDHHVSNLLEALVTGERASDTYVVLGSDHGEGFDGDHGSRRHGYALTEELLHVPLLVWGPGVRAGRRRGPVANLDILPTLVNLAGLEERGVQGRSLAGALFRGVETPSRRVYSEKTFDTQGAPILKAVTTSTHRLVYDHASHHHTLFDRRGDPGERKDIAPTEGRVASELLDQVRRFMERDTGAYYAHVVAETTTRELPEGSLERSLPLGSGIVLRGLRYATTPAPPGSLAAFSVELFVTAPPPGDGGEPELLVELDAAPGPGQADWSPLAQGLSSGTRGAQTLVRHAVKLAVPREVPLGKRSLFVRVRVRGGPPGAAALAAANL